MHRVAPNGYASLDYPGANVGLIVLPGGAIAVDAPALPADARAWRQQAMDTAGGPILYVVLTDAHPDRLLCAGLLGAPIVTTREAYEQAAGYTDGYWRSVVDGWSRRYPAAARELADTRVALPEIMFSSRITLSKGGSDVTVEQVSGAAPGSAWVYLSDSNVLFAGDTVTTQTHPFVAATPNSEAWLTTLRALRRGRSADAVVVPGRGLITAGADTRALSDYLALARRRVRSLQRAGRSRAETTVLVAELLSAFPVLDEERDLVQRRVKAGLDRLYDELKAE